MDMFSNYTGSQVTVVTGNILFIDTDLRWIAYWKWMNEFNQIWKVKDKACNKNNPFGLEWCLYFICLIYIFTINSFILNMIDVSRLSTKRQAIASILIDQESTVNQPILINMARLQSHWMFFPTSTKPVAHPSERSCVVCIAMLWKVCQKIFDLTHKPLKSITKKMKYEIISTECKYRTCMDTALSPKNLVSLCTDLQGLQSLTCF